MDWQMWFYNVHSTSNPPQIRNRTERQAKRKDKKTQSLIFKELINQIIWSLSTSSTQKPKYK